MKSNPNFRANESSKGLANWSSALGRGLRRVLIRYATQRATPVPDIARSGAESETTSAGLAIDSVTRTRVNISDDASTTATAHSRSSAASARTRLASESVTAVDDTRPPTAPVRRMPRSGPRTRASMYPAKPTAATSTIISPT